MYNVKNKNRQIAMIDKAPVIKSYFVKDLRLEYSFWNNLTFILPLASGTFLSATATALMTMSFTDTLISCCSVSCRSTNP